MRDQRTSSPHGKAPRPGWLGCWDQARAFTSLDVVDDPTNRVCHHLQEYCCHGFKSDYGIGFALPTIQVNEHF